MHVPGLYSYMHAWILIRYIYEVINFCTTYCMQTHNKIYEEELEELHRNTVWQANQKFVNAHNTYAYKFGYTLNMNEFGDLTGAEFARIFNGYKMQEPFNDTKFYEPDNTVSLPATIDWRQYGVVTEVKNQGQCGSCWSFSTTGSVEGQHARKTGQLVSLSEQNLIDCSSSYGNNGCQGGVMDNAFRYMIANKGDDTERSYPYEMQKGNCRFNQNNVGATIRSYADVPRGSESYLQSAVGSVGPVSVAIDASHSSFQFYRGGVYVEPACSSTRLDHGVLVVGYGTENGQDYWLVKNSWGTNWGENGYIKMARNRGNQCGVATQASYPIV